MGGTTRAVSLPGLARLDLAFQNILQMSLKTKHKVRMQFFNSANALKCNVHEPGDLEQHNRLGRSAITLVRIQICHRG
jgi:hypothetical protein